MRSLTLAAASTIPSAAATTISTLNDCTSPREAINYSASMTSNSGNNTPAVALTPSTHAQSHLDSVNASMAPTTQPNAGPNDSSTPMSTPILAQSASPDSKPTSIDKPDAGAIDRDDASVIAQEINAATPLQSDQCQGSPQDGLPSSSSATSVGPAQGKQSSITESVQQLADNNTASAPPNADSSLSSESNSKSTTTTLSNQSKGPVDINTSSSTSISATTQAVDPMQVDENSKKSEPEKKATGRVRNASEMLEEQTKCDGTLTKDDTVSRPSKRQALLKADIEAFNAANAAAAAAASAKSKDKPESAKPESESLPVQTASKKVATTADSSSRLTSTESVQSTIPPKKMVATPINQHRSVGRPMFRSSPIGVSVAKQTNQSKSSTSGPVSTNSEINVNDPSPMETAAIATTNAPPRKARGKPKKVSWIEDAKLVTVVEIASRKDLIKSWDPESEITLPFTSMTLANFREAIAKEQATATSTGGTTSASSGQQDAFAAATDTPMQHQMDATHADMDEERRRMEEYRKGYQRKLDLMQPSVSWCQFESVLPPECKGEESAEKVMIMSDVDDGEVPMDAAINQFSPPSPPSGTGLEMRDSQVDIPWNDPQRKQDEGMHDVTHQAHHTQQQHHMQSQGNEYRNQDNAYGSGRNTGNSYHHGNHNGSGNMYRGQQFGGTHNSASRPGVHGQHHGASTAQYGGAHGAGYRNQQGYQQGGNMGHGMNGGGVPPQHYNNNYRHEGGPGANPNNNFVGNMSNHPVAVPNIQPMDLTRLLATLDSGMAPPPGMLAPPPPPPPNFANGGQAPAGFYGAPVAPPPAMGRGFAMGPPGVMGRPGGGFGAPTHGQQPNHMGRLMGGRGKMKKKCKYFGTKQGCRDGSSCSFSHEL